MEQALSKLESALAKQPLEERSPDAVDLLEALQGYNEARQQLQTASKRPLTQANAPLVQASNVMDAGDRGRGLGQPLACQLPPARRAPHRRSPSPSRRPRRALCASSARPPCSWLLPTLWALTGSTCCTAPAARWVHWAGLLCCCDIAAAARSLCCFARLSKHPHPRPLPAADVRPHAERGTGHP